LGKHQGNRRAEMARVFMSALQPYILEAAANFSQSVPIAVARVQSLSTVQGDTAEKELMVSTNELGNLVLEMSDEWVLEAQRILRLVASSRKALKTAH
jgi:hypothetical protein